MKYLDNMLIFKIDIMILEAKIIDRASLFDTTVIESRSIEERYQKKHHVIRRSNF